MANKGGLQDGGRGRRRPPLGPAPRTLSILTALNELSIFETENPVPQEEEGEGPDWISNIFSLARLGKLGDLREAVEGLELEGLGLRHLVDGKGRNILHHACSGGSLNTVRFLLGMLGGQGEAALKERDQRGLGPMHIALRKGRTECLEWLLTRTKGGWDLVRGLEGEEPLLFEAVRSRDLGTVRWLSSFYRDRVGVSVDLENQSSGMTPLCEAARTGNALACHELILCGADPNYQAVGGFRAVDWAVRGEHLECVNYLVMASTTAKLREEVKALEQLWTLRTHFLELLRLGKWMVAERTGLIKNFKGEKAFSFLLGEGERRFADLEAKMLEVEKEGKSLLEKVRKVEGERMGSLGESESSHNFEGAPWSVSPSRKVIEPSLGPPDLIRETQGVWLTKEEISGGGGIYHEIPSAEKKGSCGRDEASCSSEMESTAPAVPKEEALGKGNDEGLIKGNAQAGRGKAWYEIEEEEESFP